MKYNELQTTARKSTKRVGRGISAGQGKTAGRGTKGQKSRTGYSRRSGFEGGQTPLVQKIPKLRGFRSHRVKFENVTLGEINELKSASVDNHVLAEAGLTTSPYVNVKVIANGELKKKVTVKLQSASESAVEAIEKAGGKFEKTPQVGRPKKQASKTEKAEKAS